MQMQKWLFLGTVALCINLQQVMHLHQAKIQWRREIVQICTPPLQCISVHVRAHGEYQLFIASSGGCM